MQIGEQEVVIGPGRKFQVAQRAACVDAAAPGPSHRQLLSYITKDKQTESLVEKLCQRFRTARYAAFPGGAWHREGPLLRWAGPFHFSCATFPQDRTAVPRPGLLCVTASDD